MLAANVVLLSLLSGSAFACDIHSNGRSQRVTLQVPLGESTLTVRGIPFSTRAYWMRQANLALGSPCPFVAFGSVIVNHTDTNGLGELVCTGANSGHLTGNPTLHGLLPAIYDMNAS